MQELLGYVGYGFIVAFYPLQLWAAIRGKTLDLGVWPLTSLVIGLVVLEASFWLSGVVPYFVGNTIGLVCAMWLLFLTRK
jgi:hypothetical protein